MEISKVSKPSLLSNSESNTLDGAAQMAKVAIESYQNSGNTAFLYQAHAMIVHCLEMARNGG